MSSWLYDLYKQIETEAVDLTADDLDGADSGALTPREKANAILRRLQATDNEFRQSIQLFRGVLCRQ